MKTIETARHAAHASAHDHPGRFYSGLAVVALGTGLWLAEVARMLFDIVGKEGTARGVFTQPQMLPAAEKLQAAVAAAQGDATRCCCIDHQRVGRCVWGQDVVAVDGWHDDASRQITAG